MTAAVSFHAGAFFLVALIPLFSVDQAPTLIVNSGEAGSIMQLSLLPPKTVPQELPPPVPLEPTKLELPTLPEMPEIAFSPSHSKLLPLVEICNDAVEHPDTSRKEEPMRLPVRKQPVVRAAPSESLAPEPSVPAVMRRAGVDRSVEILKLPTPEYPRASLENGEQGVVVVKVAVTADGRAESARIASPSSHIRLNRAALAAARKARFLPAQAGGRSVPATILIPYRFQLR